MQGPEWLTGLLAGVCFAAAAAGAIDRVFKVTQYAILILIAFNLALIFTMDLSARTVPMTLAMTSGIMFGVSLWTYRRPVGETLGEWPIRVMDRLRAVGPGMEQLPRTGPVLVIANHPSYLDPCWLMIRLPRDLTPLMYAEYYRIPGLHF
jgi:hypothetical protein